MNAHLTVADWYNRFLASRGLESPDPDRPLYGYRVTRKEFEELGRWLSGLPDPTSAPWPGRSKQLFCLFAAEWWRRHHDGGAWRWQPVLEAVGHTDLGPGGPGYPELQRMVTLGLRYWGRDVLVTRKGHLFLFTLACEGGLPLRMVTDPKRNTALRRYFQKLFEETSRVALEQVEVRRLAEHHGTELPASLRQHVVFELAARTVDRITRAAAIVPDGVDPVAWLDENRPDWRDELPIELEDSTAKAFLTGLLNDAVGAKVQRSASIGWVRWIRRSGADWILEAEGRYPSRIGADKLRAWFEPVFNGSGSLPPRLEMGWEDDDGEYVAFAILALESSEGDT